MALIHLWLEPSPRLQSTMKDLKLKVLDEVERAAPAELAVLEKQLSEKVSSWLCIGKLVNGQP